MSSRGVSGEPASLKDIAALIGNIVVHFARTERALNGLIATTRERLGVNGLEPDMPASLSKSLAFLGKAARRLPELARARTELLWIVEEATRLSSLRHDVVNGFVANLDAAEPEPLRFAWLRLDRNTRQVQEVTLRRITIEQLARAGDDAGRLAERIARLAEDLHATARSPERAS